MGYFCSTCVGYRDGEPLWDYVRASKSGKPYFTRCPVCHISKDIPPKEETGMSMSKKHYTAIAEAVAETVLDPDERSALANRLAEIFKDDNALFNPILFRNAADAVLVKEE
jgi:nitrate/TMAO reductase-like tetraheme cytochrome c subunit